MASSVGKGEPLTTEGKRGEGGGGQPRLKVVNKEGGVLVAFRSRRKGGALVCRSGGGNEIAGVLNEKQRGKEDFL